MNDVTKNAKVRVLYVATHPIQYLSPLLRRMATDQRLELEVVYCSMQGVAPPGDSGFGVEVKWDVPLLEGYSWKVLPNRSPRPKMGGFFGLVNPGVWKVVRTGNYDAIITQTGYAYLTYWILLIAARTSRTPIIFCTDASTLRPFDARRWKSLAKPLVAPSLFRMNEIIAAGSTKGCELFRGMGIPEKRIVLAPFVVDNDWWTHEAAGVDRARVREKWAVPEDSLVVLFCAKLQPWKRPLDLLRAFANAGATDAFLVFAGDGPLRADLEAAATDLGIAGRVRMLGFVNQSQLPEVYRASDLLVLPSEFDAFAVVVNEAMLCGCAAVVSDQVGSRSDLVQSGVTGFVFPCGDVEALADILRQTLGNRARLLELGAAARERMGTWSPRETVRGLIEALSRVVRTKWKENPRATP